MSPFWYPIIETSLVNTYVSKTFKFSPKYHLAGNSTSLKQLCPKHEIHIFQRPPGEKEKIK